ncbi:hypothetical protein EON77_18155, partial [bacterium]
MFLDVLNKRGMHTDFYDDENWYTLALVRSYKLTKNREFLDKATTTFADIMGAWDETCCGPNKGGLWWNRSKTSKVTAINAGAVVSASLLYEATKDTKYLEFAKKAFAYWATHMVDRATGHVYDGISSAGELNTTWHFTYNEGLFIGACVNLARVTNDPAPIELAHKVAAYMLRENGQKLPNGKTILSDGKCADDGNGFKGIGARYLGELYAVDPSHSEYLDALVASADAAYDLARDPATGVVTCDWAGPYEADAKKSNGASTSSAAVGLAAAAKALGVATPRLATKYEAEEGNLRGAMGLEAKYAGFSGWGYVAGWGADGAVDVLVDVPESGDYVIDLRYSTGPDAHRALAIDGAEREA